MKYKISAVLVLFLGIIFLVPNSVDGVSKHTLIVNSKTNKLGHFINGELKKEYRISTGRGDSKTPIGKFEVVKKLINRPYFSDNIPGGVPANPLGDRWIGIGVGNTKGNVYGVHGNNNRKSIGKNISGGCIRTYREDVRELYEIIPNGTQVIINDKLGSYEEIASSYSFNLKNNVGWTYKDGDWSYITNDQDRYTYGFLNLEKLDQIKDLQEYGVRYIEEKFYFLNASGYMHNL